MIDQYEAAAILRDTLTQPPEAVTFKSKTGEGTYSDFNLTQACRGAKQEEAVDNGRGKTVKRTIPWRIWLSDLTNANAPTPKIGDHIVDTNNVVYVLNKVNTALLGQLFDCETLEVLS